MEEVEEGLHAHMEAARATQNADIENIGNVCPPHIIEEVGVEIVEEEEQREDSIDLTDENMENDDGETSQEEAEHDANGQPISRKRGRLAEQYWDGILNISISDNDGVYANATVNEEN